MSEIKSLHYSLEPQVFSLNCSNEANVLSETMVNKREENAHSSRSLIIDNNELNKSNTRQERNYLNETLTEPFEQESNSSPVKSKLGNFERCCGLTFSYDAWHSLFIIILIIIATVVFCTSVVSRDELYTLITVCALCFLTLLCLVISVSIDPGIVPCADSIEEHNECVISREVNLPTENLDNSHMTEEVFIRNSPVLCKYCRTCHIIRPPRCSHCRYCDVCIEEFDHHCGVIGSCVGKRTFRFFTGFFVFLSLLCVFAFTHCLIKAIKADYTQELKSSNGRWHLIAIYGCLVSSTMAGLIAVSMSCIYLYLS